MAMTLYRLVQAIHVPQTHMVAIIKDGSAITADTALRLARFSRISTDFWLNLQRPCKADTVRHAMGAELASIEPFALAA